MSSNFFVLPALILRKQIFCRHKNLCFQELVPSTQSFINKIDGKSLPGNQVVTQNLRVILLKLNFHFDWALHK